MRKPVSIQEVYNNPSAILDYQNKNKNTDTSTGSSDLTDKAMMLHLVSWAKEMQKDTRNIINQNFTIIKILNDLMMYVSKANQSSKNNIFGDFA